MLKDLGFVPWPEESAAGYRQAGVWRGETLFELLLRGASSHPQRVAAVDRARRVTYRELADRAQQLARGLSQLGIGHGDAVVLQLPNCIELLELCFALFRIGARPVMAQLAHRRFELTHFVQKSGAVALVTCERANGCDHRALAREVRHACPGLRHVVLIHGEAYEASDVRLADLLDDQERHVSLAGGAARFGSLPEPPLAHEVALFQLSGGSTDVPKLIARTHDDYLYSVRQSVEVCGFDADTVYLAALPVAHNFPFSSPGVLGALLAGGRVVFAEHPSPDVAFPLIQREGVTVTALVPALLPSWLSAAARQRSALSSLRLLQVGGARLHDGLARRIEPELGCRLQQVFGMAEGLVCYTREEDSRQLTLTSQGRPMSPLDEVRVVDDHDRDLPDGELGHLLTRGPYTIRGYYGAHEHNQRTFTSDGFYRTGDLVRRLPDGSLVVEGRAKDQINRGGEKIPAPEVEALLSSHPAVEAVALVGVPDRHLGERSCAFLVLNAELDPAKLIAHLKAQGIAHYKIPDRFVRVASLPKTAVGKVDKRSLLALQSSPPTPHLESENTL